MSRDLPPPESANGVGHIDADQCVNLLRDLLEPEERGRVLAHLGACPRCEARFREMAADDELRWARVRLRRDAGGRLFLDHRGPVARRAGAGPAWRLSWPRIGLWTAAAAVITIAILLLRAAPGPVADLPPLPGVPGQTTFRDAARIAGPHLAEGLAAYEEGEYDRAVALLSASPVQGPWETMRRIYLASALAMTGRYREAADHLRTVPRADLPDTWDAEARWTLYVALRESSQETAADSLLDVLANEPGSVGERARTERESGRR